jgi:hypothetical protein
MPISGLVGPDTTCYAMEKLLISALSWNGSWQNTTQALRAYQRYHFRPASGNTTTSF